MRPSNGHTKRALRWESAAAARETNPAPGHIRGAPNANWPPTIAPAQTTNSSRRSAAILPPCDKTFRYRLWPTRPRPECTVAGPPGPEWRREDCSTPFWPRDFGRSDAAHPPTRVRPRDALPGWHEPPVRDIRRPRRCSASPSSAVLRAFYAAPASQRAPTEVSSTPCTPHRPPVKLACCNKHSQTLRPPSLSAPGSRRPVLWRVQCRISPGDGLSPAVPRLRRLAFPKAVRWRSSSARRVSTANPDTLH